MMRPTPFGCLIVKQSAIEFKSSSVTGTTSSPFSEKTETRRNVPVICVRQLSAPAGGKPVRCEPDVNSELLLMLERLENTKKAGPHQHEDQPFGTGGCARS